jgi:dihydrodipicolinate synthase/N-acetylneuraminate lyase
MKPDSGIGWPTVRPGRRVVGMSAVLLPFHLDGSIDWEGFASLVKRTVQSGLKPAVNMDTGFGPFLNETDKNRALQIANEVSGEGGFVAGAVVPDKPGDAFNSKAYGEVMDAIVSRGGIPVVMQSFGLTALPDLELIAAYQGLAARVPAIYGFELGQQFAPFGRIYSLDVYKGLMAISNCLGAKHSSLDRVQEWQRLALRDTLRPDFLVLTGNDLAIDMVMYGSDYLLGLSAFAPEHFALRDRWWAEQDPRFFALNDLLQYLGTFAFRHPVPAYKHSAAQFLKMRGRIACSNTHPRSAGRPESDLKVLELIAEDLDRSFPLETP